MSSAAVDQDISPLLAVRKASVNKSQASLADGAKDEISRQNAGPKQSRFSSILWNILLPVATFVMTLRILKLFVVTIVLLAPHNDFGKFYFASVQFLSGNDLYARSDMTPFAIPATDTLNGVPYEIDLLNMNPPHFHFLILPLTCLPAKTAFAVWNLIGVACLIGSLLLLHQELKVAWSVQARGILIFLIVASEATREVIALGQISWIFLVPVTLLWMFARRGNWAMAGVTLGILAVTKPFFFILAPLFLMQRQWKGLAACTVSGAATIGLGVLVFGTDSYAEWVAGLGQSDAWAWMPCSSSMWGTLFSRTLSDNPIYAPFAHVPLPAVKLIWLAAAGGMGLLTLAVVYFDKSPQRTDRAFALLLVGAILFSPLSWVYYFWLPVPPLVALMVFWLQQAKANPNRSWWSRHWRFALLSATIPILITPLTFTWLGQPSPWATLFISNMNLWVVLLVWGVLICDGLGHVKTSIPILGRWSAGMQPA